MQLVGFVLKVSCSTPVLGPAFGLVGVGVANVLAGQASKHTRKVLVDKAHPSKPGFWEAPDPEDALLDALLGAFIFKVCARRCVQSAALQRRDADNHTASGHAQLETPPSRAL
jgi:hypothetical protein